MQTGNGLPFATSRSITNSSPTHSQTQMYLSWITCEHAGINITSHDSSFFSFEKINVSLWTFESIFSIRIDLQCHYFQFFMWTLIQWHWNIHSTILFIFSVFWKINHIKETNFFPFFLSPNKFVSFLELVCCLAPHTYTDIYQNK